ncbi:MAG: PQQ-dependent sugar dehydrogenase, partial [Actinobacteria bacterium]|nr:PQQ-dependent sugar dehydrogenase [Actinomycetota bacterium]
MRLPAALALALPALIAVSCSGSPGADASLPVFDTAPSTTAAPPASDLPATTTAPTTTGPGTAPTTTDAAPTTTTTLPADDFRPALVTVASGFNQPLFATAPAGDDRLFVVEQDGRIQVLRRGERLGVFLDLSTLVSLGGERGLLGLAFHPDYPADPRFYVNYTDRTGATVLAEYRVSGDPERADPATARILLTVSQPYRNHNGGMIAFGPDGYLYVALGDGGGSGDPLGTGQDPASLLGSILRLSPDGDPYTVPPNHWVDAGGAAEVWAKGL